MVKRSKVKVTRPLRLAVLAGQHGHGLELVTDPDACMMYIVSPLEGLGGGILWRPPAYSMLCITRFVRLFVKKIIRIYFPGN